MELLKYGRLEIEVISEGAKGAEFPMGNSPNCSSWRRDPGPNQIPERYYRTGTEPNKNTMRGKELCIYFVRSVIPPRTRDWL